MIHFLTYYTCHTFDLLLSCPKCQTYCKCVSNLSLSQAQEVYDDWRLFGACDWCGGGDGPDTFAGIYYRVYGVYLPFPHLVIATDPVELRRLVDEREFGSLYSGFAVWVRGFPAVDVKSGKLAWGRNCLYGGIASCGH